MTQVELLQTPSEGDTPVPVTHHSSGTSTPGGTIVPDTSGPKQTRYIADDYPSDEDAEGSTTSKRTDEGTYW